MKRISNILPLLALLALIATACGKSNKTSNDNGTDSTSATVTPYDLKNPAQTGEEQSVYGVTIDRAMNSIAVLTSNGDTLYFEYPENANRNKFAKSNIGDTVTVKYVTVSGEDSLTAIFRGKRD